jgi:hypothetical protein
MSTFDSLFTLSQPDIVGSEGKMMKSTLILLALIATSSILGRPHTLTNLTVVAASRSIGTAR